MHEWIQHALSADRLGLAVLPAAFLLGALGAVSSCCTAPVIGAVAGYAGSLGERPARRELSLVGLFFVIGAMIALALLGAVTSFVGGVAGASLGRYWRFAAGLVIVFFGLSSLRLLPFRIPKIESPALTPGRGVAGAVTFGLAVGGATTACTMSCNPLLPAAVGAAMLQGAPLLGALTLAAFALGYSLPLGAGLIGIGLGLGQLRLVARAAAAVRMLVGAVLVAVGFYLVSQA